jgi:hypothetical protein
MKYKSTIIRISIHPENVNPIFGEQATHVSIKDEGGGPFIELSQERDDKDKCVRVDMDELEIITAEAKKLIGQFPKEKK